LKTLDWQKARTTKAATGLEGLSVLQEELSLMLPCRVPPQLMLQQTKNSLLKNKSVHPTPYPTINSICPSDGTWQLQQDSSQENRSEGCDAEYCVLHVPAHASGSITWRELGQGKDNYSSVDGTRRYGCGVDSPLPLGRVDPGLWNFMSNYCSASNFCWVFNRSASIVPITTQGIICLFNTLN
jgi:hypothetical protein